jgi:chromosome segregation ATPase
MQFVSGSSNTSLLEKKGQLVNAISIIETIEDKSSRIEELRLKNEGILKMIAHFSVLIEEKKKILSDQAEETKKESLSAVEKALLDVNSQEEKIEKLNAAISQKENESKAKQEEIARLEVEMGVLSHSMGEFNLTLQKTKTLVDTLKKDLQVLRMNKEEKTQRLAGLREQMEARKKKCATRVQELASKTAERKRSALLMGMFRSAEQKLKIEKSEEREAEHIALEEKAIRDMYLECAQIEEEFEADGGAIFYTEAQHAKAVKDYDRYITVSNSDTLNKYNAIAAQVNDLDEGVFHLTLDVSQQQQVLSQYQAHLDALNQIYFQAEERYFENEEQQLAKCELETQYQSDIDQLQSLVQGNNLETTALEEVVRKLEEELKTLSTASSKQDIENELADVMQTLTLTTTKEPLETTAEDAEPAIEGLRPSAAAPIAPSQLPSPPPPPHPVV